DDIAKQVRQGLQDIIGGRWEVVRGEGEGAPTFYETMEAARQAEQERIRNHPLVAATFAAFPDAQMVEEQNAPETGEDWSKQA
ncbi:MAG: DNA polymerase III subunit gamma/tau, partial [Alteraurantiacibacter sp.]